MAQITICIEGGIVVEVRGIPPGVKVVIRDYDIENYEEDRLVSDGFGRECHEEEY